MTCYITNVYTTIFGVLCLLSFAQVSFAFPDAPRSVGADSADSVTLIFYYGEGCPHCARMEPIVKGSLNSTFANYTIHLTEKEVYFNPSNRQELLNVYIGFGLDPQKGGIPLLLIDNRSVVIGELSKERFEEILFQHVQNRSVSGIFTQNTFSPLEERTKFVQLTIPVLIGAALVDSVNPCTIAVMVMLLSVILATSGRKKMLLAAAVFISVIFVCYLLYGLGVRELLKVLNENLPMFDITNAFYTAVTVLALVLAVLEFVAYFDYRPGFFAVEMPLFLRPYAKAAIAGATSIPGVAAAALFCSIFLLPCSSGPYLMVLAMLQKAVTPSALLYLVVYNIIFVLPMAVIALAVLLGKATLDHVSAVKERYVREMHLFAGLVLLILFFIMASQILHIGFI